MNTLSRCAAPSQASPRGLQWPLPLLFTHLAPSKPSQKHVKLARLYMLSPVPSVNTSRITAPDTAQSCTRLAEYAGSHLLPNSRASRAAPRHWTLAVTYETNDRAYATVYEVEVDVAGDLQSRVIRRVHLTSNHPSGAYGGKILLGEVNDNVLSSLEAYSETAAELVNTGNRKRGPGSQSCHDWATIIVRSLEDSMLLPQGALTRVEKCPRFG